jgi:hypothetical protein
MNADVAAKYGSLIERLFEKTKDKAIKWSLNERRTAKASFGQYNVVLYDGNSNGSPLEYISLSTQYDEPIETIDDEDLVDVSPSMEEYDSYYPLMEELRMLAFRQAVGADKALDDILGELDD